MKGMRSVFRRTNIVNMVRPRYTSSNVENWSWVPPKHQTKDESVISVIEGKLLTVDEIVDALNRQRAINVVAIPLKEKIDTITHFVICSGESRRHLKTLAGSLVTALRARKLRQAPGCRHGIEGADDNDWMLVDCYDTVVHVMTPATRNALKLEEHWTADSRPQAILDGHTKNRRKAEQKYDDTLEELSNRFPPPEDYNVLDGDNEGAEVTQKHSSGFTFSKVPPGFL